MMWDVAYSPNVGDPGLTQAGGSYSHILVDRVCGANGCLFQSKFPMGPIIKDTPYTK